MTRQPRRQSAARELAEAAQKDVQWVSLDRLRLDPQNPRLPEGFDGASQTELLETLAKDYDLQDLGQSIADNGYFSEEPLVAVKDRNRSTWTIVEGNRRLAALQLLNNPGGAPASMRERWTALSKERKLRVTRVPILEYDHRDEVTPYLGFRHITGVMQWRPYQKARYISQLVEGSRLNFTEIARIIGSRAPTVREHYIAYTLVRQARDDFLVDTSNVEGSFGVLRRALSDPDIRSFMGLDLTKAERELARPLPRSKAKSVKEVFAWIFGTEENDPVLTDSRELKKLGVVLSSSRAVDVLRSTENLDYAFELSGGEERRLLDNLNTASYHLDQALPLSIRHRNSRDVTTAVRRCLETLNEIVRHFPAIAGRK
ncbi:MAG: hypothetical protein QOF41_1880 [Methylobacteriaceae bacterium]|nr:hypothetical protein [Methylobacteriaceae bacterium]